MKNRKKNFDAELAALARKRDEEIDTTDIPEVKDWSGAVIGKFYRPIKEAVCLRVDVDVLTWFRSQGPGYQTRINELLRNAMTAANTAGETVRSKKAACREAVAGVPEPRCRTFYYPGLERHGELQKCNEMAGSIAERRCLFASAQ